MHRFFGLIAAMLLSAASPAMATVFAAVHGIVHDAQHRPIAGAQVVLHAADSEFSLQAVTDMHGEFVILQIPIGIYRFEATAQGFIRMSEKLTIASGTNPVLHITLPVGKTEQTIVVHGTINAADSMTPSTLITRADIDETPGASRTLGMEMITNYVPGAYVSHDMLHIRGGHQTSWLIDGIAIPNTKIASNVGPQIAPEDINSLETERGSYMADIGDRTYGVFNVLPRNGFERNREGELRVSVGSLYSGEAQLSLGNHSEKTAWYASLVSQRANYGLASPVPDIHHDATNSESMFASLIRNQTAKDQLRFNAQYREDYFQIPYDPNPNDWEQASQYYSSYGLRDAQHERDAFVIGNWVHTLSPKALFSIAPFYHLNQANYDSAANDMPTATTWHQQSNYVGTQIDIRDDLRANHLSAGLYSFYQKESDLFGIQVNDGSSSSLSSTGTTENAGIVELYIADNLRINRYITLSAGERFSIYRSGLSEWAAYPRIGATAEIPKLHWILRGFYGHFFQPAPVQTVSASVLNYAANLQSEQNTFTPLPSERDEEHQFGILIPFKGWTLDVTNFKTRVNNFLDHANLGESNMYFPIAVNGALVRAWELTVRSPELAHIGQFHLAYSNQIAQQRGGIVGGFTCGIATDPACSADFDYESLDHDQRHTLNTGFTAHLPAHTWLAGNMYYGSGFANGLAGANEGPYNGPYLPAHTTFDLSAGIACNEHWQVSASALNVTNHRILLDNSITIGGFHYNDPRIFSAEVRYKFHF